MKRLTYKDRTLPRTTEHGELIRAYSDYNPRTIINKLSEYEDLEEQGRLVVLPCKMGDTVYFLSAFWRCGKPVEETAEIIPISFNPDEMWSFRLGRLKRPYFLTRAEAEAVLKGVSEDA